MNLDDLLIKYPLEGVTTEKFAELLGKSKNAVDMMVKADKIPFIEIQDQLPSKGAQSIITVGIAG